jgi:uncharacterized protein YjbJ (UPF0337 family)
MDKDRIAGSAKDSAGKVKGAVGDIAGDAKTQASGRAREASGSVQNLYGQAKEAAAATVDRLAALEGKIDMAVQSSKAATITTSSHQKAERALPPPVAASDVYGTISDGTGTMVFAVEDFDALRDESDDDDLQEIKSEVLRLVGANLLDSPEAHLAYIRGRLKSVA